MLIGLRTSGPGNISEGYDKKYSSLHYKLFRYGSRINNDRFPEQAPKEQAVKGMLPREIFLDFGVSELFAQ